MPHSASTALDRPNALRRAALALLVFSGLQVSKMAISFMPEVNSRQMSARS